MLRMLVHLLRKDMRWHSDEIAKRGSSHHSETNIHGTEGYLVSLLNMK
jgi:hypothetical protein